MTVSVQRMCNSRIDRNIVGGVRFESVRITIRNITIAPYKGDSSPTRDDFTKYTEICTQLFPPTTPETDILGEIIHAGIETMHMLAQMDKEKEASQ